MGLEVKLEDNTISILNASELAQEQILYMAGNRMLKGCVEETNKINISTGKPTVDTGRYRNAFTSLTFSGATKSDTAVIDPTGKNPSKNTDNITQYRANKGEVMIANNVEYAVFLEVGSTKMPARNIMRRGVENQLSIIKSASEKIVKGEL